MGAFTDPWVIATAFGGTLWGIFGGALPPLVAGTLRATYGSWAISPMLAVLAVASLVCTYLLPETKGTALQPPRAAGDATVPSEFELPDSGR